ncbi:class I adenylate-forming enzyme family protein [Maritimibacter dapengensis]|uniref:AMP-binding protein n=1 Tax=Maritimibacter dapengensis TaxID=2836868 RepID=A0ABS6SYI3_9RHOB|nr:AMP-binding protein [Maritimibacter dapengensis]MBV7378039.1 AMP-binding protein [Maritimibacter dapengensis]
MNMAHWLARAASRAGDDPALFYGHRQVASYGAFFREASSVAGALREQGIEPGDRVALFMKNVPDYLIVLYGIWICGAAAVPINAKLHAREAAFIVEASGAKMVFVTDDSLSVAVDVTCVDVADEAFAAIKSGASLAIEDRAPEDLAWLFYTSGTTGQPKGVRITHGMLLSMSLAYLCDVDDVAKEDAAFYMAPMSHGAGLYALVHVLRGARHICPASGGFDAGELLDAARGQGPLSMFMAPTMVRRITDAARAAGDRADGIKTIVYGGGPMYVADIVEAVDWFGPKFVQIYGQGECPMSITALSREDVADRSHPNWKTRLASVGCAQSVVEVAIGDADGNPLAPGAVGEIMVRGHTVMPGYWQNEAATAKTIRDGWLMTGDMGLLDGDGYLTLRDRSKDVIISGGTNIYPREVEEALLTLEGVREVSVLGRPDPEWGEDVVAFVVADTGVDVPKLDAHCLAQIARFKRPKAYIFTDDLPKNNYGKVLKTELRERLKEMNDEQSDR